MATKKELLAELTEAGVEGYSMSDDKSTLEEAVARIRRPVVSRVKGV